MAKGRHQSSWGVPTSSQHNKTTAKHGGAGSHQAEPLQNLSRDRKILFLFPPKPGFPPSDSRPLTLLTPDLSAAAVKPLALWLPAYKGPGQGQAQPRPSAATGRQHRRPLTPRGPRAGVDTRHHPPGQRVPQGRGAGPEGSRPTARPALRDRLGPLRGPAPRCRLPQPRRGLTWRRRRRAPGDRSARERAPAETRRRDPRVPRTNVPPPPARPAPFSWRIGPKPPPGGGACRAAGPRSPAGVAACL